MVTWTVDRWSLGCIGGIILALHIVDILVRVDRVDILVL